MSDTSRPLSRHVHVSAALIALLALLPSDVIAGPHRARLSKDLQTRIDAARSDSTHVIVSGTGADVQALAMRYGARLTKAVRGGAVLEVTGGQLDALSQDPAVDHLSGDVRVQRMMAVTPESTGATIVWSGTDGRSGFTGRGIGVAIIDSGIGSHSALRGRVAAALDFTANQGSGVDKYGHGTHVAGIVAGSDAEYPGIAPGAHIVSLKVLDENGAGQTSDVINAIDWTIEHKAQYAIRVVNLSLGHPVFESYRDDPLCLAVQRAVDAGLLVVAAAGNLGKTEDGRPIIGGVISPGNSPAALTVGALNTAETATRSDDVMASYSSRGPTYIDGVLKPDLAAPGNRIAAPAAPGAYLTRTYPERIVAGEGSHAFIQLSGTSMASAVVAGAAALLLEERPSLTPADVKLILQLTSSRVAGAGLIEAGAGSLNAAAAVALAGHPEQGLPSSTIAGEAVDAFGIAFGTSDTNTLITAPTANILVWGNSRLTTSRFADLPHADILVWGNGLVWGNILVWGSSVVGPDILVWGSDVQSDILVWGNILVWGSSSINADILVWGNDVNAT